MIAPLLFIAFIVVPLLELAVILQVGRAIGPLSTVAALLLVSVVGAALVKREGLRAWRRFRLALEQGRIPADEVIDGALVLLGGALMLTPGFITDAVGLLLVIPLTRQPANWLVRSRVRTAFGLPQRRHGDRIDGGEAPPTVEVVDIDVVKVEEEGPPADNR